METKNVSLNSKVSKASAKYPEVDQQTHDWFVKPRSATLNFLNAFDTSDTNDLKSAFFKMNDIFLKYMMSSE